MIFTERETAYLAEQRLGRLATLQPDGTPQVNPVGFAHNTELDTIDVPGHGMRRSRKFRNVEADGRVSIVVDDVLSTDPMRLRCLEVRGVAEAVLGPADAGGDDGALIRIRPRRIISFGINSDFDMAHLRSDNRDVV